MRRLSVLFVALLALARPAWAQQEVDASKIYLGSTGATLMFLTGSGSPEGVTAGPVNSQYYDYSTGKRYRKNSGSGNTGWVLEAGTVTSLDVSVPTGLTATGCAITTSGTCAISLASGYMIPGGGGTPGTFLRRSTTPEWSALILPNGATQYRIPYAVSTNEWGDHANFTYDGAALRTPHHYPQATDSYDLGSYDRLWRNGYLSKLTAVLFALETQTLFGGYSTIGHDAGTVAAAIGAVQTTVDFGKTMTVGDWVLIRSTDADGAIASEYMLIGELSSGTRYNVTRDLASAHATDPNWARGTPFLVLGQSGDGRIDMLAYDGKPRTVYTQQGATYSAQNVRGLVGNLNGYYGYSTDLYGAAFGVQPSESSGPNLTIDPTNGLRIRYGTDVRIQLDGSGNALFGASGGNRVYWDGTNIDIYAGNLIIDENGIKLPTDTSALTASKSVEFTDSLAGSVLIGGVTALATGSGNVRSFYIRNNTSGSSGGYDNAAILRLEAGVSAGTRIGIGEGATGAPADLVRVVAEAIYSGDGADLGTGDFPWVTTYTSTLVSGTSYTSRGVASSIANVTPTTIFAATAAGRYEVYAAIPDTNAALYTAIATVISDGTNVRIDANNGAALTITVSGADVQVTQSSGGAASVIWSYFRIR